jgi:galactonate dehydratase
MKITAIRPFVAWIGIRNQLLVKVETDEGVFGWGESGLSGREKAVMGAMDHYGQFPRRARSDADRSPVAGDVPQPVFRGRPRPRRRDLGHRHRAPRHQGQSLGRAGLRPPRRQAARPDSDLRDDLRGARPGDDRAGQMLVEHGWTAMRLSPSGHEHKEIYEPREHIATTAKWCVKAREALGPDVVLGIDYPPSPQRRGGRELLPEDAVRHAGLSRGAHSGRVPGSYEALRRLTNIPFAIGEEFASKWQFQPISSATSTSITASMSAMWAA